MSFVGIFLEDFISMGYVFLALTHWYVIKYI